MSLREMGRLAERMEATFLVHREEKDPAAIGERQSSKGDAGPWLIRKRNKGRP